MKMRSKNKEGGEKYMERLRENPGEINVQEFKELRQMLLGIMLNDKKMRPRPMPNPDPTGNGGDN